MVTNGTNTPHEMRVISLRFFDIIEITDVILMDYLASIASISAHNSCFHNNQAKQNQKFNE